MACASSPAGDVPLWDDMEAMERSRADAVKLTGQLFELEVSSVAQQFLKFRNFGADLVKRNLGIAMALEFRTIDRSRQQGFESLFQLASTCQVPAMKSTCRTPF